MPPVPAPDLASAIRLSRGDRSLRWLAAKVGVSPAHLSRVEQGERSPSMTLVTSVENALQLEPGALVEQVPALPAAIASDLGSTDIALAVGRRESLPPQTYARLRRLHLAAVAERFLRRVGGSARLPIDPVRLASQEGLAIRPAKPWGERPVKFDGSIAEVEGPAGTVQFRFWVAHALGHALLGDLSCDASTAADVELDASALASFLLVPTPDLAREVYAQKARLEELDTWDPADLMTLVAAVASRFVAPAWVVARRLGEEGRLAEVAEVDER